MILYIESTTVQQYRRIEQNQLNKYTEPQRLRQMVEEDYSTSDSRPY